MYIYANVEPPQDKKRIISFIGEWSLSDPILASYLGLRKKRAVPPRRPFVTARRPEVF